MSVERFVTEIEKVIDYFRKEYDLTYSEAIGAIHMIEHKLTREAVNINEEQDGKSDTQDT